MGYQRPARQPGEPRGRADAVLWQGGPIILDRTIRRRAGQFSDEIQLSGVSFGDRLNWILGASYIHERPVGVFVRRCRSWQSVQPRRANPDLKTNDTVTDDYSGLRPGRGTLI